MSVENTHIASLITEISSMASKIAFTEELQILYLLFMNQFLGDKWFFSLRCFFLQFLIDSDYPL